MSVTALLDHPCHSLRARVCVTQLPAAERMERICLTPGSRGRSANSVFSATLCRSEHTPASPSGKSGACHQNWYLKWHKNEISPAGPLSRATGQTLELPDSFQTLLTLERIRCGCFAHCLCFLEWVMQLLVVVLPGPRSCTAMVTLRR